MNEDDKTILCRLIRDHEDLVGSSRATMLALQAFKTAIQELKCSPDEIRNEYAELADAIKNTRPKIVPLIHLIEEFEQEIAPHFGADADQTLATACEILQAKHDRIKDKVARIIQLGLDCIEEGDVLVMHTASADVTKMIALAKEVLDRTIKVIVLKQDFIKTKKLIDILKQARVDLETVPEFSLSHYIGKANKMFTGALSISHDLKIVSAVGTASIASLCHFHKIPVYLFANTLKFSHGLSENQRIHEKRVTTVQDNTSFVLTTYSHDMLDIDMVDFLVTEEGIYPKEKIRDYVKEILSRDRHH
jgi:translation initiation factor 2B subunit (eIF-2B alpha/beta/delta family)